MSDLQIRGPLWGGSGTPAPFTAGFSAAQRVADAHARYMQAVIEGRAFALDSDSVTLAAANVTKTALGTAKFINGFYNPVGSGRNAVLWSAHIATVSGTPGGPYFWNFVNTSNLTSATTGTIRNLLLAGAPVGSAMQAQAGVVLAATPASTAALTQLGVMGGPAAIAAGAGLYDAYEEVAGQIIVPPGIAIGLMCLAAGTTHVVQSTLRWEEIQVMI